MNIHEHVDLLRQRLRACHATHEQVAAKTDGVVSASWVAKFAVGRMRNPRVDSLVALSSALDRLECPSKEAA
jgi:hypothetical protein